MVATLSRADLRHRARLSFEGFHNYNISYYFNRQLYRMLTQVRAKKREREKAATLEIHPEIQVKLQLSRFADNKNRVAKSSEKPEQKSDSKKVGENNQNDEQSFRSFLKYQSLPSPPGRSRRKARPSSYQLYKQQQKTLKQTHYNKINQWKTKLLNAPLQHDNPNKIVPTFTRTHSNAETRSLHKRQITMPFRTLQEVVAVQPIQHPSFRSNYIKTSEGRRKMVDNNTYLRKLKARIQFYSLSAIITERHNLRIRGAEGANVQIMRQQERRGSTQEGRLRNHIKYGKSKTRPRNGSNGDLQGCRPWSGFKQDFSNELSSLV